MEQTNHHHHNQEQKHPELPERTLSFHTSFSHQIYTPLANSPPNDIRATLTFRLFTHTTKQHDQKYPNAIDLPTDLPLPKKT